MAKLSIDKEHLNNLLNIASLAVGKRDEDDITNHFHFEVNDGNLKISAHDRLTISNVVTDKITSDTENFKFTLKSIKILGLLSTLKKADTITLEYNEDEMNVLLNGKYDLPSHDPEDFVNFTKDVANAEHVMDVEVDKLADALRYINGFIGNDLQGKPELTTSPILDGKMVAGNGKTLGIYESEIFTNSGFEIPFNIISNLQKFSKIAGTIKSGNKEIKTDQKENDKVVSEIQNDVNTVDFEDIVASTSEKQVPKSEKESGEGESESKKQTKCLTSPSVQLYSTNNYYLVQDYDKTKLFGFRKSDHKFPEKQVEKSLTEEFDDEIQVPKQDLLDAINRLSYCIDETSNRMSFKVTGSGDSATLTLSVLGSHKKESKEIITVKRLGDDDNDLQFDLMYLHLTRILPLYLSPEIKICVKKNRAIKLVDNTDQTVKLSGLVSVIRSR